MVTAGCGHGGSRLWSWWSWWQQVVVMRLRTSNNRLNAHMFKKMKLAASPTCNCGLEDQKAEHILQRCPRRQQEQTCGQRQSRYTPNSTAARRNWRRQLHSSCRLDSQCSSDREEKRNRLGQLPYSASCSTARLTRI